jgi:hypothetical protein
MRNFFVLIMLSLLYTPACCVTLLYQDLSSAYLDAPPRHAYLYHAQHEHRNGERTLYWSFRGDFNHRCDDKNDNHRAT